MTPMSAFTLRSAAGLPAEPSPLSASTLIVIDAQHEYANGRLALPGVAPALANIVRLLGAARSAGAPVVHVAHQGATGGLFDPSSTGAIIDDVVPRDGEVVVMKTLPNSFASTTLQSTLDELGDRPLIVAGFMTHMCVSATTRAALDLGYRSTVVSDACSTRSLPSATGGADVSADVVHAATLAALADRFAIVATTHEVLTAADHIGS